MSILLNFASACQHQIYWVPKQITLFSQWVRWFATEPHHSIWSLVSRANDSIQFASNSVQLQFTLLISSKPVSLFVHLLLCIAFSLSFGIILKKRESSKFSTSSQASSPPLFTSASATTMQQASQQVIDTFLLVCSLFRARLTIPPPAVCLVKLVVIRLLRFRLVNYSNGL